VPKDESASPAQFPHSVNILARVKIEGGQPFYILLDEDIGFVVIDEGGQALQERPAASRDKTPAHIHNHFGLHIAALFLIHGIIHVSVYGHNLRGEQQRCLKTLPRLWWELGNEFGIIQQQHNPLVDGVQSLFQRPEKQLWWPGPGLEYTTQHRRGSKNCPP
jgi:hypothetical protein